MAAEEYDEPVVEKIYVAEEDLGIECAMNVEDEEGPMSILDVIPSLPYP